MVMAPVGYQYYSPNRAHLWVDDLRLPIIHVHITELPDETGVNALVSNPSLRTQLLKLEHVQQKVNFSIWRVGSGRLDTENPLQEDLA